MFFNPEEQSDLQKAASSLLVFLFLCILSSILDTIHMKF